MPGELLDEEAAEQRPDDARHTEHRSEESLVATALTGGDDVSDDRLGADHQPTASETLNGSEGDQLGHRAAQARESRATQEDHDRRLKEHLAAVLVAEFAPQRRRDRHRQQIRNDDPRQVRRAVQVRDDRRQRGRDDRLIERRQEHPQHQRADDDQHPPVADVRRPAVCGPRQSACSSARGGCSPMRPTRPLPSRSPASAGGLRYHALPDLQHVIGRALQVLRDPIPVHRSGHQRLKNQQIERPWKGLRCLGFSHHLSMGIWRTWSLLSRARPRPLPGSTEWHLIGTNGALPLTC